NSFDGSPLSIDEVLHMGWMRPVIVIFVALESMSTARTGLGTISPKAPQTASPTTSFRIPSLPPGPIASRDVVRARVVSARRIVPYTDSCRQQEFHNQM